jgi:hypothetical protein
MTNAGITDAIRSLVACIVAFLILFAAFETLSAQDFNALSLSKARSGEEGDPSDDDVGGEEGGDDSSGGDDQDIRVDRLFDVNVLTGATQSAGDLIELGGFSTAQLTSDRGASELFALLDRGSNARIATLDPSGVEVVSTVPVLAERVSGIAARPFESSLFVAHGIAGTDRLGVLNARNGSIRDIGLIQFASTGNQIDILAFSPSGELWGLENLAPFQGMRLWRIETRTLEATLLGITPRHFFQFEDAFFLGDELWALRASDGVAIQISLTDASVPTHTILNSRSLYGLAGRACTTPSISLSVLDNPRDSGGAILLDWSDYAAPSNLVRFDILRELESCDLVGGNSPVVGSVLAGQPPTFVDSSVENYTSYFYKIQVVGSDLGIEEVVDELDSGAAAAFPNVVINEFAPAGGVSKVSKILVGEFIELFNLSSDPIDLTGWLLSNGAASEPVAGTIPANGLLVHTLAVIDLPDAGGLLELLPPDGTSFIIDDVAYGSEGAAPTAPAGFTISRVDGTDASTPDEEAFNTSQPTPDEQNAVAPPNLGSSLVFNEVHYVGTAGEDYIEFFNPTGGTIALQRFAISDGVSFVDTLDSELDLRPGGWFVLDPQGPAPFTQDLVIDQLYLYKITETGLLELVDHLGWGPGEGDPQPPGPDPVNDTLVRILDGDALYLGDVGTNWIECGGDVTLFYGPETPGTSNSAPNSPTLLVDPSGVGDFTTIKDAIAAATPGVRILVAPGTYKEQLNLKDQVSIIGIGSLPVDVIISGPGGTTPVQAIGVGAQTEVSRVSLRGGYAAADGPFAQTPASGGALRVVSASPAFKNVRFEYNIANNNGGAVAISAGSPIFEGCQFFNNFANQSGGAVWVADGNPSFRSCLFVGNESGIAGAVMFVQGGTIQIDQCVMDNNTTQGETGIVYATGGTTAIEYSMVTNSRFGPPLWAVEPGSIQFSCGLLFNTFEEEVSILTAGAVDTTDVVQGNPGYCQPLAFNFAYPDASPVMSLPLSCNKIVGVAGPPCGQTLTDVEVAVPPTTTQLHSPVPNPFNPSAVMRFDLGAPGRAELVVYDVRGRRVVELLGGVYLDIGVYQVEWRGLDHSGRRLGSGIYYAQLRVNDKASGETQKLVLLK